MSSNLTTHTLFYKHQGVSPKSEAQISEPRATSYRVMFYFLPPLSVSCFLDFPDSWFNMYQKKSARERNTPCVTRKQWRRGDVYYCHYVCQVFTRWQCSVVILLDKFYHTWNHFRNFLGPPFSLFLSLSVSVSP